jgi:hypothetical protein
MHESVGSPRAQPISRQWLDHAWQHHHPGGAAGERSVRLLDGVNQTTADVVPPPAGISTILSTQPDLIPEATTALGCPSAHRVVENLCVKAQNWRRYLDVYAGREAGPITNFNLLSWTQPVMFKLINRFGQQLHHRDDRRPVVLSPTLTLGSGSRNRPAPENTPGHLRPPPSPASGCSSRRPASAAAGRCEEHRG